MSYDVRSHVGLTGVFMGLATHDPTSLSTICDLAVRHASAFYIGVTVRTPSSRFYCQPAPHWPVYRRMYPLHRTSGSQLASFETMLIARYHGNMRMANIGAGGEHIDASAPYGWVYVVVIDEAAAAATLLASRRPTDAHGQQRCTIYLDSDKSQSSPVWQLHTFTGAALGRACL